MHPQREPKTNTLPTFRPPKTLSEYSFDFLSFLELFCLPLGSLWPPFWLLWPTLGSLLAPFGFLWAPLGLSLAPLRTSSPAEAKFRRDLAEILPRTCREPSKNPPRTRRMNPKQSCLSHCDFFEGTSSSDKRFDKIA